jgi:integrase
LFAATFALCRDNADMGVAKRPDGKWRARVVGPDGRERSKHFPAKSLAQRWEREQLAARDRGQFVDPSDRTTVAEYARQWAAGRPHRPLTAQRTVNLIEKHIACLPIGERRLASVRPSEVQAWVTDRSRVLAPSTIRLLVGHLSAVYSSVVLDRLVSVSPVQRIKLPDARQERIIPLTVDEVERLADAVDQRNRSMIITQAGLGLRLGEVLGLRVQDVNFLGRSVKIEFQRDRLTQELVPPKTPRSRRTVPLPEVVANALAAHLASYGVASDGGIFTMPNGSPYKHNHFQRGIMNPGVAAAGLPAGTTSHDLRHHFASLLLASGESVVAVAEYLGHENATLVLKTYGHLIPGREDRMRQAIDGAWTQRQDSVTKRKPD